MMIWAVPKKQLYFFCTEYSYTTERANYTKDEAGMRIFVFTLNRKRLPNMWIFDNLALYINPVDVKNIKNIFFYVWLESIV